jgi:hypothetical protein
MSQIHVGQRAALERAHCGLEPPAQLLREPVGVGIQRGHVVASMLEADRHDAAGDRAAHLAPAADTAAERRRDLRDGGIVTANVLAHGQQHGLRSVIALGEQLLRGVELPGIHRGLPGVRRVPGRSRAHAGTSRVFVAPGESDATIVTRILDAAAARSWARRTASAPVSRAQSHERDRSRSRPAPAWGLVPCAGIMPIEIFVDQHRSDDATVADDVSSSG